MYTLMRSIGHISSKLIDHVLLGHPEGALLLAHAHAVHLLAVPALTPGIAVSKVEKTFVFLNTSSYIPCKILSLGIVRPLVNLKIIFVNNGSNVQF
ncbi:hypothetical protein J6590_008347 [Homalodisca vitripennis]|nr:hypothetical protein J6590_008347 [Homalodisca vitripennis]